MNDPAEKKVWFIGYHSRLWIPVSWEGGLWFGGIFAVGAGVGFLGDTQARFSLGAHWPVLVALLGYLAAFYWFTRGHVDKRY